MAPAALVLPPGRWRTPLRVQARRAPDYLAVFGRRLGFATVRLIRPLGAPSIELMFRRPAPVGGDPPDLG